jgi:hypothetical protein
MRIQELLETIDNLIGSDSRKEKYIDQVWDILQKSYASQGGLKGKGFGSKQEMLERIPFWKIFRRGDRVKVVLLYKDKGGRKRVATGTDGDKTDSIPMLAKMIRDDFLSGRAYGEVSGKMLNFIMKQFSDEELDSIAIPAKQAKRIDPGIELIPGEKYKYNQDINGQIISKLMLGTPGNKIIKTKSDSERFTLNRLNEFLDDSPLDVKTRNTEYIAKKHGVPEKEIEHQLRKGIGVELEHTSDHAVAREIALDHLLELPDYYDRLEKMEN